MVIGLMDDFNLVLLDDVKVWFNQYYGLNNVILVFSGDINVVEVKFLVDKYFGDIELGLVFVKW